MIGRLNYDCPAHSYASDTTPCPACVAYDLSHLPMRASTNAELLDGIKRRIGLALNNDWADAAWHRDQLRGMQRFILEWEKRNAARPATPQAADASRETHDELLRVLTEVFAASVDANGDDRFTPALMNKMSHAIARVRGLSTRPATPPALDELAWVPMPTEPTPQLLEPFARSWCEEHGIDPDEPQPPHGAYPRWYEACGGFDALYKAMLSAATSTKAD